jgi:hypothetical protein
MSTDSEAEVLAGEEYNVHTNGSAVLFSFVALLVGSLVRWVLARVPRKVRVPYTVVLFVLVRARK